MRNPSQSPLAGRSALVTGASRGLGAALSRELAARGVRVVLVARDARAVEAAAERLRAEGGEAYALPADIGDKAAVYPLAGAATALVGPIDILIHNASTLGPTPLRLLIDTGSTGLFVVERSVKKAGFFYVSWFQKKAT